MDTIPEGEDTEGQPERADPKARDRAPAGPLAQLEQVHRRTSLLPLHQAWVWPTGKEATCTSPPPLLLKPTPTHRSPCPLVPQVHQIVAADTAAHGRQQDGDSPDGASQGKPFLTGAHIFSGPSGRTDGVQAFGALRGLHVEDLDLLGGHDLSHPSVCGQLLSRAWRAEFGSVVIGPPCSSYSPALRASGLRLRSRRHPKGRNDAPPGWRSYIRRHNGFGNLAIQLAWAQHHTGGGWVIEQPADTGRKGTPWYWPFAADGGSLWLWPEMQELARQTGAVWFTFAQCMLGAQGRKYTTILASQSMARHLTHLHGLCCPGVGWHTRHVRAFGSDEFGTSRAARAAAYPPQLNQLLAAAMALAAAGQQAGRAVWRIGQRIRKSQEWADGLLARLSHEALQVGAAPNEMASHSQDTDSGSESGESVREGSSDDDGDDPQMAHGQFSARQRTEGCGGRVADGPGLTADVRAVCELAATAPAAFASQRNRREADADELRTAELPCPRAAARSFAQASAAQPSTQRASRWDGTGDWRRVLPTPEGCPTDDVPIHALFLPGVYESVLQWIQEAEEAMRRLLAGEQATGPPELVVGQHQLQPWARGVVWDCRNPEACTPVVRSTRDTVFPGRRQLDRQAFRQVAADLEWDRVDPDIIGQVGEGGVEARTTCSLDMVLGFHHRGVRDNTDAARKVIAGDLVEGWVAAPVV